MDIRKKIITYFSIGVIAIALVSFGMAKWLEQPAGIPIDLTTPTDPPELLPEQSFNSEVFTMDEGYSFDLLTGWKLASNDPSLQVNRYRFEKDFDSKSVLVFSFYKKDSVADLDQLQEVRYGSAVLQESTDMTINERPARRVTAGFDIGGTGSDILFDVSDTELLSIQGVHAPNGEAGIRTAQQIDYMQQSVKWDQPNSTRE